MLDFCISNHSEKAVSISREKIPFSSVAYSGKSFSFRKKRASETKDLKESIDKRVVQSTSDKDNEPGKTFDDRLAEAFTDSENGENLLRISAQNPRKIFLAPPEPQPSTTIPGETGPGRNRPGKSSFSASEELLRKLPESTRKAFYPYGSISVLNKNLSDWGGFREQGGRSCARLPSSRSVCNRHCLNNRNVLGKFQLLH